MDLSRTTSYAQCDHNKIPLLLHTYECDGGGNCGFWSTPKEANAKKQEFQHHLLSCHPGDRFSKHNSFRRRRRRRRFLRRFVEQAHQSAMQARTTYTRVFWGLLWI